MKVRDLYSIRERVQIHFDGRDIQDEAAKKAYLRANNLTNQEDRAHTDIEKLLKKISKGGNIQALMKSNPRYGDFSDMPDYLEAHNRIELANEQFMALDAHVRKRFGNNPAEFLAYASDPKNLEGMIELGLASKKPVYDQNLGVIAEKITVGTVEKTVPVEKVPV